MRRLAALLLAFVAAVCVISAPPAAADDGVIHNGIKSVCEFDGGSLVGAIVGDDGLCDKVASVTVKGMKHAWKSVWDSVIGDIVRAAMDVAKWVLKKMFTVALLAPSLNLEDTGLFGKDATLAGMLVWLGWVIAAAGFMWQIGKMAVTGQAKHVGTAMRGWLENVLLTGVGLTFVAGLLAAGDAMTSGLVDKTFANDGEAYERIVAVMLPAGIANPVMMLGVVAVILIVGFIQMILIFLRQSAIPIQCLLLPVAGGGRVGGEATRQWAPRLITSILVVIAYKPIVAVIICVGFAEFGHAQTLSEWLRGIATLILAVIAPGPLTRLFAPFGERVGEGLAAGGAMGAAAAIGGSLTQRGRGGDGGGDEPDNAVTHARRVEQTMPRSYRSEDASGGGSSEDGRSDAVNQAARTAAAQVPGQTASGDTSGSAAPAAGAAPGAAAGNAGQAPGADGGRAAAGAGRGAAAAGTAGLAIQVLDGVNDAAQRGAREIGDGGSST
ncbi:hypothetical protein [Streptomyces sp. NPDC058475]|uniref:hypothetical protein n=1 Tax=unclassified Streptomyces TaxID=2593676 RepID=UPI003667F2EA